jgi:hypothetical protein
MEQINAHRQETLHATVNVNTVKAKFFATVGPAAKTRSARTAKNVGINRALVADPDAICIAGNLGNLS